MAPGLFELRTNNYLRRQSNNPAMRDPTKLAQGKRRQLGRNQTKLSREIMPD
jgi:hypothetical protein